MPSKQPGNGGSLHDAQGPFRERVHALHDIWQQRRYVRPLASAVDFQSQSDLLRILHEWATESATIINEIYAGDLLVSVEAAPTGNPPGFGVSFGNRLTLTFLVARRERGAAGWTVTSHVSSLEEVVPPGTASYRRNGPWSRTRLEELLLSVIGVYERGRDEPGSNVPGVAQGHSVRRR